MSKKKLSLEEAKALLGNDKVFYNGRNKFNVVDGGKYHSGITIEIPQDWTIDKSKKPQSPFNYRKCRELTDGMNIDFDGDAEILLGNYRLSKNNRPVFEVSPPTKAKYVLVRVSWGGAFNKTRGQYDSYAKEIGATFFRRSSSNGGGVGNDYWILPVDFVFDMDSRDVTEILQTLEDKDLEKEAETDKYLEEKEQERQNSIANRARVLEQINPIIDAIMEYTPKYQFRADEETFTYSENKWREKTKNYDDSLIEELSNILEEQKRLEVARNTFKPIFINVQESVKHLNLTFIYGDEEISVKFPESNYICGYDEKSYNGLLEKIINYEKKLNEEREEARRKEAEIKRSAELQRRKEEAKELGYPESFHFWNRLGGATHLSHAFVVELDGTIREPDYNELRNSNHRHHDDWLNSSDGTQEYEQILPGEVIVTYTKQYTRTPYIFNVAWADRPLTEEQLDVLYDALDEQANFADDINGNEITCLEDWLINSVKAKAEECKKQLEDKKFAEEIVSLANEKAEAQEKNEKAKELNHEYEDALDSISYSHYREDD